VSLQILMRKPELGFVMENVKTGPNRVTDIAIIQSRENWIAIWSVMKEDQRFRSVMDLALLPSHHAMENVM
jgi:hypothetical protein